MKLSAIITIAALAVVIGTAAVAEPLPQTRLYDVDPLKREFLSRQFGQAQQLVDVGLDYIRKHPEKRHFEASATAVNAASSFVIGVN
jgi:hypothetical protein